MHRLRQYTKDPNFVPERVARYSVACQSFCQWVLALEHYHKVHKVVLPKQLLHAQVSGQLQVLVGQLQAKETQLREVGVVVPCCIAGRGAGGGIFIPWQRGGGKYILVLFVVICPILGGMPSPRTILGLLSGGS